MSAVVILSMGEKGYKQFTEKDSFIVDVALTLSMAVDVWNTTVLSYYLWTAATSVFRRTSHLMNTIMRLTMGEPRPCCGRVISRSLRPWQKLDSPSCASAPGQS
jgi:hypothetical protein